MPGINGVVGSEGSSSVLGSEGSSGVVGSEGSWDNRGKTTASVWKLIILKKQDIGIQGIFSSSI